MKKPSYPNRSAASWTGGPCILLALALLGACSSSEGPETDAGATADAGDRDADSTGGRDAGSDAGPLDECVGMDDGAFCGPTRVCRGEECIESTCGDGVVDPRRGEECDVASTPDDCEADCTLPEPPDPCAGISAPAGAVLDPFRTTLEHLFPTLETGWGSASVTTQEFELGQYVSARFTPTVARGEVAWSVGSGVTGGFRVRISECPNDFRTREEAPGADEYCILGEVPSTNGLIRTVEPGGGWQCPMTPGRTYYLNVWLESCPVSACRFYGTLRPHN